MKFIFHLLFLSSFFTANAQKQLVVDANATVRSIEGTFSAIKVSSGINVYLSQADVTAVAVSASEQKFADGIKTTVLNGVLYINYSGDKMRYNGNNSLNVYVAFKNIDQIQGSGAADIVIAGELNVPLLNVQLSGASNLKGQITTNELNVKLSGASDVRLTGNAKLANFECSGASDVKSYGLVIDDCNVKASGASDINITVTKNISANASGASNIFYKGDAAIKNQQSSGASSFAKVQR